MARLTVDTYHARRGDVGATGRSPLQYENIPIIWANLEDIGYGE